MTQTRDLIKKMADFFKSEEYYEKGEDARLVFSPDDVRCVNRLIQRMSNLDKIRAEITDMPKLYPFVNHIDTYVKEDDVKKIIDKYKVERSE